MSDPANDGYTCCQQPMHALTLPDIDADGPSVWTRSEVAACVPPERSAASVGQCGDGDDYSGAGGWITGGMWHDTHDHESGRRSDVDGRGRDGQGCHPRGH